MFAAEFKIIFWEYIETADLWKALISDGNFDNLDFWNPTETMRQSCSASLWL